MLVNALTNINKLGLIVKCYHNNTIVLSNYQICFVVGNGISCY